MNTDEPTKDLKQSGDYKTTPIMEVILERINAVAEEMAALREEQRQFREEVRVEFRRVNKRLDLLSADFQQMRADEALLEEPVEQLERKAS